MSDFQTMWSAMFWEEKPQKNRLKSAAALQRTSSWKKLTFTLLWFSPSPVWILYDVWLQALEKKCIVGWYFCGLQLAFYWQPPTLIYIFVARLPISSRDWLTVVGIWEEYFRTKLSFSPTIFSKIWITFDDTFQSKRCQTFLLKWLDGVLYQTK